MPKPHGAAQNQSCSLDNALQQSSIPSTLPMTLAIVGGQAAFLTSGYLASFCRGTLSWEKLHISAVLDHQATSLLCGFISLLPGVALLTLEATRPSAYRRLRLWLAGLIMGGILLTCAVRESECFVVHAGGACVAFGAGVLLVCVIAACQPACVGATVIKAAALMSVVCVATGLLQGLYLLGLVPWPSAALAFSECSMVIGFGAIITATGRA